MPCFESITKQTEDWNNEHNRNLMCLNLKIPSICDEVVFAQKSIVFSFPFEKGSHGIVLAVLELAK